MNERLADWKAEKTETQLKEIPNVDLVYKYRVQYFYKGTDANHLARSTWELERADTIKIELRRKTKTDHLWMGDLAFTTRQEAIDNLTRLGVADKLRNRGVA